MFASNLKLKAMITSKNIQTRIKLKTSKGSSWNAKRRFK